MLEIADVALTFWLLLPAYTPNNFAVLVGGGKPLDFGKTFVDGKRILGDGKTIRGSVGGVIGGLLIANLQYGIERLLSFQFFSSLTYQEFLLLVFLLSFGAVCGDALGSFLKRRLGYARGDVFPVVDQLMFLAVAFLIASYSPSFFKLFDLTKIIIAFIITPPLHLITNFIAYKLGLKNVPW
ncbi:CDP-2,3-bis-(O-geranylgeranyl)-sn-glycerol synthase [Archaeoglobales archaeon]|nr:MAG: CDP-2,3-bis-(O-geranylgeranyl)-sn-glycerol synthase [Archaeoglobales archaeon]